MRRNDDDDALPLVAANRPKLELRAARKAFGSNVIVKGLSLRVAVGRRCA